MCGRYCTVYVLSFWIAVQKFNILNIDGRSAAKTLINKVRVNA